MVKYGLLSVWFHLLISIVVLENKIVLLVAGAWQSVLDCIDRFEVVFNLGGHYFYFILSASFAEHVNLFKVHFLGYLNLLLSKGL